MGRSAHDNKKAIDESVGGLVWVQRQNGSWWPGRILSPDKLPETILPVPRAGTPIQLLGREDASLDWYNLETSKRVKAFRCGEYDSCIQKVKASMSNTSKKTVGRYTHRDDAIILALEIESACEAFDKDSSRSEDYLDLAEGMPASNEAMEEQHHVGPSSGTFEWKLKGRRKSRSRKPNGYVYRSDTILDSYFGKSGPIIDVKVEKSSVHPIEPQTRGQANELAVPQRLMPHRKSRSTVNPKYDPSDFYIGDCNDDFSLYDITLEAKTSYQPQHIPNISLMSKLTHKSIVDRPLNVDVLEYGMVIEKRSRGRPRTKNVGLQQPVPPVKSQKSKKHRGSSRNTRNFAPLTGSLEPEEIPVINTLANPVLACVPLRVVFNRLNAALNSSV